MRPDAVGPVGRTVCDNIRTNRLARNLTTLKVSDQLTRYGRPISHTDLLRIESGLRTIDVDDLAAFSTVLGVPAVLMLGQAPVCRRCKGKPPVGFICGACGMNRPPKRRKPAA